MKGSSFERDISKRLSLWWTNGRNDAVFWRSSMSGGRATVRGRQGKETKYQSTDITYTDAIGEPLIDLVTIEVKRGYNKHTVADVLDRTRKSNQTMFEEWHQQVHEAWQNSGSFAWMLITRRDKRTEVVYFPTFLFARFSELGIFDQIEGKSGQSVPRILITGFFRHKINGVFHSHKDQLVGITLEQFFKRVKRHHIEDLVKRV